MKILENTNFCNGCTACASICPQNCIVMQADDGGFLFPEIDDEKCNNCGICQKTCPMNKSQAERIKNTRTPNAFAVVNKNEKIRMQSSSGGVFTLFAEKIISENGVVFGAKFNDDFSVFHSFCETADGIADFRGSKYVQSEMGDSYKKCKEFLQNERKVLFTGTPCQIGGLKAFLGKEHENLICVDFICHGVPSPKFWLKYVDYVEKLNKSKTRKICFRRKGAWNKFSVSFTFANDTEYWKYPNKDEYFSYFFSNVCLRMSCYNCGYKTVSRTSDITIADFWGIQDIAPEMFDAIKGTSLVLVQSEKGEKIFDSVKSLADALPTDLLKSVGQGKRNPVKESAATNSKKMHPNRSKFLKNLDKLPVNELIKRYVSPSFVRRGLRKIKRMLFKGGKK